jgi:hypothetical protein
MKTKNLILMLSLTAAVALAIPAHAKSQDGRAGETGFRAGSVQMEQSRTRVRDTAECDGSGPGQGTPLQDGSGKAYKGKGNPNGTGTPLKDGSGGGKGGGKGAGKGVCPQG